MMKFVTDHLLTMESLTSSALMLVAAFFVVNKHKITGHPLYCSLISSEKRAPPLVNSGYVANVKAIVSKDLPEILLKWSRDIGPIFQMKFPFPMIRQPMLVISGDLHLSREVLNDKTSSKAELYDVYKFLHDGGDDLFTSEGEYWAHSRKSSNHAFSSHHMKRMHEVVTRETKQCMENLRLYAEKNQPFDVGLEMIDLTFSIICNAAFQYEISAEEKKMFSSELSLVLRELEMGRIPFRWSLGSAWIPTVVRAREASQNLLAFTKKMLESYRALESPVKGTVVDLIANNKNYKSDKERLSDMLFFLVAGHDTTAYTIAWTLLLLAKFPDEQAKLQRELQSMKPEDRKNSERLKCIIKESMRYHPVLPLASARIVNKDIKIARSEKNELKHDIFIPKKSIVICSQYLLNQNPKYYHEPHVFKPSRWTNPTKEQSAAFMPYSLGRRNCVGQSLAKIEIIDVLSSFCAEYSFSIHEEGTVDLIITQQPVKAMMFAKKRNIQ